MILSVQRKTEEEEEREAAAHSHHVDVGVGLCAHTDAGTLELLECAVGTISLFSITDLLFLQTYSALSSVTLWILSCKGRGGGLGLMGFLRRSLFAVCSEQGLRACQTLWHR